MSQKDDDKAQQERKSLLPMADDELPFYAQPHTPISLAEIGGQATQQDQDSLKLSPMADDEPPFIEQEHTQISLSDLEQTGIIGTLPRKAENIAPLPATETVLLQGEADDEIALPATDDEPREILGTDESGTYFAGDTCALPALRPMEDDELPFIEQGHTKISLGDLEQAGIIGTLPRKTENITDDEPREILGADESGTYFAGDMCALPALRPMDDDELPFIEQGYTQISLDDLARSGIIDTSTQTGQGAASVTKVAPQQETDETVFTADESKAVPSMDEAATSLEGDMCSLPALRPMDDDELPFSEQSYVEISITELNQISEIPKKALQKKAPRKNTRSSTAKKNNSTKPAKPAVKKKTSPAKRKA